MSTFERIAINCLNEIYHKIIIIIIITIIIIIIIIMISNNFVTTCIYKKSKQLQKKMKVQYKKNIYNFRLLVKVIV